MVSVSNIKDVLRSLDAALKLEVAADDAAPKCNFAINRKLWGNGQMAPRGQKSTERFD